MNQHSAPGELLIARHGEAHCNRDGVVGGPAGCRGLTEHGRYQIELLAQRLGCRQFDHPVHALYTTPLRRTRESAAIIGMHLNLTPEVIPQLAEQDHGSADGRPWQDVVREYGDIPALAPDRPLTPDGETWRQYLHRSSHALRQILAQHDGDRVLILGHGETVDTAFHTFFDLPANTRSTAAIATFHASLTIWKQQPLSWTTPDAGLRWTLPSQNDIHHLASIDDVVHQP
ncbi:histidine phosphatase family protein [Nocardia sp. XZ_19_369]|uniref:histidine phosphatase family protein n=1 Tax=Nocardia sp. XZ_19_369 TaxID=2769487 RepID=UPI0018901628|nr:histidine phosphatase family protein [Nocardia sp. XZ_19_369]